MDFEWDWNSSRKEAGRKLNWTLDQCNEKLNSKTTWTLMGGGLLEL